MSEDAGSSSTNPRAGTPARPSSSSASGSIGSIQTPTTTPAGRLTSLRGGRGGSAASSSAGRGSASKLKFTPTVPAKRNKKDAYVSNSEKWIVRFFGNNCARNTKNWEAIVNAPSLLDEARAGTGPESSSQRGREKRPAGRGRGRFRTEEPASTASGPFSLGPAAQAARSRQAAGGSASGAHSSYTGKASIKIEGGEGLSGEDRDYYGDAAVDMKFGTITTDASVPTGLENPKQETKSQIKEEYLEEEHDDLDLEDEDIKPKLEGPAKDLLPVWSVDQMFFFQFPSVMPAFKPRIVSDIPMSSVVSSSASSPGASPMYNTPGGTEKIESEDGLLAVKSEPMDLDQSILTPENDLISIKAEQQDRTGILAEGSGISSAPVGQRARPKPSTTGTKPAEKEETTESHLEQEGKIGRLLVYKSGKVKMQIGDIVMDVSSGSECSFLQDIVVVDSNNKQAFVMGSVEKRMVCVPNLTQLLNGVENMNV
ncbi:hypothetical protein BGZ76_001332 [Entomortierella beljakovae]|nr:hypothetical protein BGZ76_001332 [Entomortierella beljakovae]